MNTTTFLIRTVACCTFFLFTAILSTLQAASDYKGNSTPEFTLNYTEAAPESTAMVPVTVSGFEDMVGFAFTIEIDNSIVGNITGFMNGALEIDYVQFSDVSVGIGWNNPAGSQDGLTLVDGEVAFYLLVELTIEPGVCTNIAFEDSPIPLSAVNSVNGMANAIIATFVNGEVCTLDEVVKAGNIQTENGTPVQDVEVTCNDSVTVLTDVLGNYLFDPATAGQDFTITPRKDINYKNGIDLLDYILIRDHFLGNQLLTSPYQLIAADVNDDCLINVIDELLVKALFLFQINEFQDVDSWRFVPEAFSFAPALQPCDVPDFVETIELIALSADALNENFVAVKMGDVNQNAAGDMFGSDPIDNRTNSQLALSYQSSRSELTGEHTISFYLDEESVAIRGIALELALDLSAWKVEGIYAGSLPGNIDYNIQTPVSNTILLAWNHPTGDAFAASNTQAPLFHLKLSSLSQEQSVSIRMQDALLRSEAYDANLKSYDLTLSQALTSSLRDAAAPLQNFALYPNYPNPFDHETSVRFFTETATNVNVLIFDLTGRLVYSSNSHYPAGYHEVAIGQNLLGAPGSYIYRVVCGHHSASGMMILSDTNR